MQSASPIPDRQSDVLDPARANALLVALGRAAGIEAGDALPPFFHHIYFWDAQPPEALGRDGHPRVGGVIPDTGLPRRMWAGGRLTFHAPLLAGKAAEKRTVCEHVQHKTGRSGPLAFVTLRHEIWQDDQPCITEWQDLVYREEVNPTAAKRAPKPADAAVAAETAKFSTTLLFRYSALTFNGHRIHYDMDYATGVEGYDGLVVHGPLLAQLLMLKAEAAFGHLKQFQFRAVSPLMHHEAATLSQSGGRLWAAGPDGRLLMTAEAS